MGGRHQRDLASFFLAPKDPLEVGADRRRTIHPLPGRLDQILAGGARSLFGDEELKVSGTLFHTLPKFGYFEIRWADLSKA